MFCCPRLIQPPHTLCLSPGYKKLTTRSSTMSQGQKCYLMAVRNCIQNDGFFAPHCSFCDLSLMTMAWLCSDVTGGYALFYDVDWIFLALKGLKMADTPFLQLTTITTLNAQSMLIGGTRAISKRKFNQCAHGQSVTNGGQKCLPCITFEASISIARFLMRAHSTPWLGLGSNIGFLTYKRLLSE